MKENGQDPSKVPELTNAQNDVANEDVPVSAFMESVTKVYDNAKATTKVQSTIASEPAEVRNPMSQIKGVGAVEPMMPESQYVPGTQPQIGEAPNFSVTGLDTAVSSIEPLSQQGMATNEDPLLTSRKSTVAMMKKLADQGQLSPKIAAEFHKTLEENNDKMVDLEIAKEKTKQEELRAQNEAAGKGFISATSQNMRIFDNETGKETKQVNFAEAMRNPDRYSVVTGSEIFRPSSSWGAGGGVAHADETKLQTAVIKRLAVMYPNDFSIGTDDYGNPVYRVKPDASPITKRTLSDPDSYNQFIVDFFPDYARKLKVPQPTGTGNDPLGIR
jgi:hypothetical protein